MKNQYQHISKFNSRSQAAIWQVVCFKNKPQTTGLKDIDLG